MYLKNTGILFSLFLAGGLLATTHSVTGVKNSGQNQLTAGKTDTSLIKNRQASTLSAGDYTFNYVPVSPSASELTRRVLTPVNYGMGTLDVNIPLYEIKMKNITIPVVLRCRTTGIKVSEPGGTVGLGWNLEYGPSVARSVDGLADESGYLRYNSSFGSTSPMYLSMLSQNYYDETPDIFSYSTLSSSGRFVFKRPLNQNESNTYRPIFFPLNADKLSVNSNALSSGISITDKNGNFYQFGNTTACQETTYGSNGRVLTGWNIASIINPDNETITFSYKNNQVNYHEYYDFYAVEDGSSEYITSGYGVPPSGGYWQGVSGVLNYMEQNGTDHFEGEKEFAAFKKNNEFYDMTYNWDNTTGVDTKIPVQINYPNGKIIFDYDNFGLLIKVHIYEVETEITTIALSYTEATGTSYRRRLLQTVQFTDNLTNAQQSYSMNYHNTGGYNESTKAVDYWGYYNGYIGNEDLVVSHKEVEINGHNGSSSVNYTSLGKAYREPYLLYGREFSLETMTYPNGGREYFVYGQNRALMYDGTLKNLGGIRIDKIDYYDNNGVYQGAKKIFYGIDGVESGMGTFDLKFEQQQQKIYVNPVSRIYRRYRIFSSRPTADPFYGIMPSALYQYATETDEDRNGKLLSRNVYHYNAYSVHFPYLLGDILVDDQDSWNMGLLLQQTIFKTDSTLLQSKVNEYGYGIHPERQLTDVRKVFANNIVQFTNVEEDYSYYDYQIQKYNLGGGDRNIVLTSTVTDDYFNGSKHTSRIDYLYGKTAHDVKTSQPTSIKTTGSDGSKEVTEFTYPYHNISAPGAAAMNSSNDITKPLQITTKKEKGSAPVETGKITFNYSAKPTGTSSNLISVQHTDRTTGTAVTDESYSVFDSHNNICEINRPGKPVTTLLWGYNFQRLIAIIEGASYAQVIAVTGSYDTLQNLTDEQLRAKSNQLRNALPAALVTLYLHNPQRAVKEVIAPNGNKTTYTYDGFGRLTETRNRDNALHQYNYYQK